MINNCINVRENETGKIYSAFPQAVDLNFNGKYILRWNIGINGYNEWSNICCEYDNDAFNKNYTVVKWSHFKKEWIPETQYKFWIDGENAVKQGV